MAHQCKFIISIIFLLGSISSSFAMEVYISGEIKKTTACCYVIKTSDGRFFKILKPKKKVRNADPFKFRVSMSHLSDSFKNDYHYWKGRVNLR